ncbi:MAG TPA: hypothetical protein ENK82_04105 [Campylobacterales bacterium]|nr:hypothetical protein [Campylobacterales bacterium]
MKKILTLFVVTLSLLLASEDTNLTHKSLIDLYDMNGDEMIFYTEAPKEIQDDFCQYDVNQDGYIDKDEVEAIK